MPRSVKTCLITTIPSAMSAMMKQTREQEFITPSFPPKSTCFTLYTADHHSAFCVLHSAFCKIPLPCTNHGGEISFPLSQHFTLCIFWNILSAWVILDCLGTSTFMFHLAFLRWKPRNDALNVVKHLPHFSVTATPCLWNSLLSLITL